MSSAALASDPWAQWDSYLQTLENTGFMQSSGWSDFRVTRGFEHFGCILKHRSVILGGAIVQKRAYSDDEYFYYIQDGPVLPSHNEDTDEAVFATLLAHLDERRLASNERISHLRIEPRWTHTPDFVRNFVLAPEDDDYIEPRRTLCIDLRNSEQEILAQMKPKGRYNIGVARRHGVCIAQDASAQGIHDFVRIYQDTACRQSIDCKSAEYFHALLSAFLPAHRASLFFAEYGGERLATALVVYFGNRATYFFGGSLTVHRNVMAPYLLHFEIMRNAKASGYTWYDMWGIAPEAASDDPWQQISAFKRKFGGIEIELTPTLDYVYDPAAYACYLQS